MLIDYLKNISTKELTELCAILVEEYRHSMQENKVTKSMFTFLERMFACSVFNPVLEDPENSFAMDVYNILREETTKTRDSEKLTESVEVFCQLLQVKDTLIVTTA